MSRLVVVFGICISVFGARAQFMVPPVSVQALEPSGIRVSIPDVPGIKLFAFNGKVNEVSDDKSEGTITGDVKQPINGRWIVEKPEVMLNKNDVISYGVFVQYENLGYRKDGQSYVVDQLYPKTSQITAPNDKTPCQASITKTNTGGTICKNALIFSDDFRSIIDKSKWIVEHKLPSDQQEIPFVSYQKSNVKVVNEKVEITPTFLSEMADWDEDMVLDSNEMSMGPECTGTSSECEQVGSHVPPIVSGRISTRTKFSFKYGKIEIRAKLPVGSWLYPELYLEPSDLGYGSKNYESGVMRVAFARGNNEFSVNNVAMDNKVLFGGLVLTNEETCRSLTTKNNKNSVPWGDGFHTYGMIWEADKITLQVDGKTYGDIVYPRGLKSLGENCPKIKEASRAWGNDPTLIPFDQEFHITLGVGVGGIADFPNTPTKPWKNSGRKARLDFWSKRNEWSNSWLAEGKKLIIDSVKVWAI